MKPLKTLLLSIVPFAFLMAHTGSVSAQQVTGTLGSPSATTTIPGNQLPAPQPPFGGVIKNGALQSTPWWAPRIVPPASAPNVLLIITDDAGFAVPSTFGGVIPTPTMDRIAKQGLRYNRVFSTTTRPASGLFPSNPPATPVTTASSTATKSPSAAC